MKRKHIVIACAVVWRGSLALAGVTAVTEGHPVIAGILTAVAGVAMELKDQLSPKAKNVTP